MSCPAWASIDSRPWRCRHDSTCERTVGGKGRELGLKLRAWQESGTPGLLNGKAMANRLVDLLGADEVLKGPIRDLAVQPLFLRALSPSGAARDSSVEQLSQQLAATYAPAVLAELLDLLEAATGVALPPPDTTTPRRPPAPGGAQARGPTLQALALGPTLSALGPGLALAASFALVLRWFGGELERELFEPWGWPAGVVLAVTLGLLQALALGPLKTLRRQWPLEQADASEPRQAWRWITAPWIHHSQTEAAINVVVLLILLGPSPLPLPDLLLRYALTSLATTALALVLARRGTDQRRWDGAAGAISALIGLGAASSLLHWRALAYPVGDNLAIPCWVLLLVYGALQLSWQLPRQSDTDLSRPLDRLLSCQWWWGLVLGVGWAVVSRLGGLVQLALRAREAGG